MRLFDSLKRWLGLDLRMGGIAQPFVAEASLVGWSQAKRSLATVWSRLFREISFKNGRLFQFSVSRYAERRR